MPESIGKTLCSKWSRLPNERRALLKLVSRFEFTREQATAALEALGAKVSDNVSSKTTGVIVGEEPGKSKLTKAEKTGVPLLTEAYLLKLLGRE